LGDDGFGLPQYVTTTYDHFGWERKRTVVYNCHIYLTALRAAKAMATDLVGDGATANATAAALATATAALPRELWNATTRSFRATSDGDQTFTDSLYGQMLSHHKCVRACCGCCCCCCCCCCCSCCSCSC